MREGKRYIRISDARVFKDILSSSASVNIDYQMQKGFACLLDLSICKLGPPTVTNQSRSAAGVFGYFRNSLRLCVCFFFELEDTNCIYKVMVCICAQSAHMSETADILV